MADHSQMSREELLKAKERVEQQLERLSYRPPGSFPYYGQNPKPDLTSDLTQILDEINYELEQRNGKST
jgi:hypothetical protein